MPFDIEGAKKAGYSDAEIADHLASDANFDIKAARKSGYSDGEILSHLSESQAQVKNTPDINTDPTDSLPPPLIRRQDNAQAIAADNPMQVPLRNTPEDYAAANKTYAEYKDSTPIPQKDPSLLDKIDAAAQTGESLLVNTIPQSLGFLAGTGKGIYEDIKAGQFGQNTGRPEQYAQDYAKNMTVYNPTSDLGNQYLQNTSEFLSPLAGLPISPEVAAIGNLSKPAIAQTAENVASKSALLPSSLQDVRNLSLNQSESTLSRDAAPTVNALKDQARSIYKEIDNSGVVVPKDQVQSLYNDLRSSVKDEGFNKTMHPAVNATLKEFRDATQSDQPITNIDTLRKVAGSAAGSMDKSESRLGKIITGKIDSFMDNLDGSSLVGGTADDIGSKYKDARQLWQRASKAELIDRAMEKAKNQASGFENGVRTQFRSILNNDKKSKMFTPEEKDSMEHVIQGGTMENLAKYIGKFGFGEGQASNMMLATIGAGAGGTVAGIPGAVAVPLIGQASRSLAQKMTRNNAAMVSQLVRSGKDSTAITRAYLANTPIAQRSATDLAELLLKMNARDKIKIKTKDKDLTNTLSDVEYLMGLAPKDTNQEAQQ